ncbi:major facilitator superfamily domain-containing protein [Xylariomycetidae sp. FL2044]|nr:major facilitator superfamily domain-containing protein [Xylariomycetidae sp. FL2044]
MHKMQETLLNDVPPSPPMATPEFREPTPEEKSDMIKTSSKTMVRETSSAMAAPAALADPSDEEEEEEPVPDGGWTAWSQVVASHIAFMVTWGYGTAYAVFQLHYKTEHAGAWSTSQVSWIGSAQLSLYFLLGLVSGRLADAGHARATFAAGAALVVLGMFATSFAGGSYWQLLLAQGICQGVGGGLLWMPTAATVGTYFRRNRVLAMALNACGASTGAIVFASVIQFLPARVGFAWAVRVNGFITAALCAIALALLKPRKTLFKKKKNRNNNSSSSSSSASSSSSSPSSSSSSSTQPFLDLGALAYPPFDLFAAGALLIYGASFALLLYINSFARESVGLSAAEAVDFLLVSNAVGVVSRPIAGVVADRHLGALTAFGVNSLLLGAAAFGWIGATGRVGTWVYATLMGFLNGAAVGVFPGAAASLVPDVAKIGTWVGMSNTLVGLGTLAGPPAMGAIIDASGGSYLGAQLFAGLIIFIGAFFVLMSAWLVGVKGKGKLWCKV